MATKKPIPDEALESRQQRALRIKKAAMDAGFKNLGELAEACGYSRQQGYAWGSLTNPQRPTADSMKAIARLTSKSVGWLDEGTEDPSLADGLDYEKLKAILKIIEEETSARDLELTPEQLTEFIVGAYSEHGHARQRFIIQRLVRLLSG